MYSLCKNPKLFKDPINSGLAQFDHAQSYSKKMA